MQCFRAAKRRTRGTAQVSWPPLDQHIAVLYFYVISVSETQEQLLRLLSWAISHLLISLRKNMILIETARDQHGQMCEALSELDNHDHQISWRYSAPSELHLPKIRKTSITRMIWQLEAKRQIYKKSWHNRIFARKWLTKMKVWLGHQTKRMGGSCR